MLPTFNEHGDLVLLEHYSVWAEKIKAGIWLQLYFVPARMVISGNQLGNANDAQKAEDHLSLRSTFCLPMETNPNVADPCQRTLLTASFEMYTCVSLFEA